MKIFKLFRRLITRNSNDRYEDDDKRNSNDNDVEYGLTAEQLFDKAITAFRTKQTEKALYYINLALEGPHETTMSNQDKAYCFHCRGAIYRDLREHDKALKDFDRAVDYDDKCSTAYNSRALILQGEFQNYEDALSNYNNAIELNPSESLYYFNRAYLYRTHLQNYELSLKDYTASLQINPSYAPSYNNRGLLLESHFKKYDEALQDYNTAIQLDPRYGVAYYNRAALLESHFGRYEEALADINEAIRIDKNNFKLYIYRANILSVHLKRFYEALQDYNTAVDMNRNLKDSHACTAYNNRGVLYRDDLRDLDKALKDFDKAISIDARSASAHANKAQLLFEIGKTEEAKQYALRSMQFDAGVSRAYYVLGTILWKEGNHEESIQNLNKFLSLGHPSKSFFEKAKQEIEGLKKMQSMQLSSSDPPHDNLVSNINDL